MSLDTPDIGLSFSYSNSIAGKKSLYILFKCVTVIEFLKILWSNRKFANVSVGESTPLLAKIIVCGLWLSSISLILELLSLH